MKFLTYSECARWCAERGFPTRHFEGYIVGPDPDLQSPEFHFVEFSHPTDSGRKVWLARFLYSLLEPSPELLIWLGDWAVWESGQHMPLFTRFREALGERRPLIEAPGHIFTPAEADEAISVITVSLLFIWNCHVLSASGGDAVFTSHDEFGWFGSRDPSVTERVRKRMEESSIVMTTRGMGMKQWTDDDWKMLCRLNATHVTKDDLLALVEEAEKVPKNEREDGIGILLVTRLHHSKPEKAQAIYFRMEALSHLLEKEGAPGWTLPRTPDGAIPTQVAVLASAAVEPLTRIDNEVGFERNSFLNRVLAEAEVEGHG